MRFTDRVIEEQRQRKRWEDRQSDKQQDEFQEEEMGMAYSPRPHMGFLNNDKGVFAGKDDGINTAPSIFQRTTIFDTHTGE